MLGSDAAAKDIIGADGHLRFSGRGSAPHHHGAIALCHAFDGVDLVRLTDDDDAVTRPALTIASSQ